MWMRKCCRMLNGASGVQASHLPTQMESGFSVGISRFQIRRDLTRKTLSLEQENSVSSEDDHGRPRRDCEGNVSLDW